MTTPQDPRSIDAIIDSFDGGPAFPQPQGKDEDGAPYSAREIPGDSGMSLRDWFAGMALQGLLASGHFTYPPEDEDNAWMTTHLDEIDNETGELIHRRRRKFDFPEAAWRCAEEMLAARKGDA